jgi:hypothetical protein
MIFAPGAWIGAVTRFLDREQPLVRLIHVAPEEARQ